MLCGDEMDEADVAVGVAVGVALCIAVFVAKVILITSAINRIACSGTKGNVTLDAVKAKLNTPRMTCTNSKDCWHWRSSSVCTIIPQRALAKKDDMLTTRVELLCSKK